MIYIELYLILGLAWALLDFANFVSYLFYNRVDTALSKELQDKQHRLVTEICELMSLMPSLLSSILLTVVSIIMFAFDVLLWPIGLIVYFIEHKA